VGAKGEPCPEVLGYPASNARHALEVKAGLQTTPPRRFIPSALKPTPEGRI